VIPCHEFYDYEAKYVEDGSKTIIPANIPESLSKIIQEMAIRAFQAIDCFGFARVDFLVEKDSLQVYINEINTIPGFTSVSMYPMLWQASGVSYTELITRLIELAIEKFEESKFEI
jgi:D-alanine-D-alanine ligase